MVQRSEYKPIPHPYAEQTMKGNCYAKTHATQAQKV